MVQERTGKKRAPKAPRALDGNKIANGTRRNSKSKAPREQVFEVGRPPATFRGLMPTPPEVKEMIQRLMEPGRPWSESFLRLETDYLNSQFYFGGNWIAFRETPQGREVLAVGWEEIGKLKRKRMKSAERQSIVLGYAEPWYFPVPCE